MSPHGRPDITKRLPLAGALFVAACLGDVATVTGRRGGQHNTPYPCSTGALNNAWIQARLGGGQQEPPCPYHVLQTSNVAFAAYVFGPKATTSLNGDVELGPVNSVYDGLQVVPWMPRYWQDDPNASDNRLVQFNGYYLAGYTRPDLGQAPWSHDSGTVIATGTNYGTATAFLTMSGSDDATANLVVVPGGAAVGELVLLRAFPAADTNAYSAYAWKVDGVSVPGNGAQISYAFTGAGTHTVTALITDLDTTYTASDTVKAYNVTISGPSTVKPFATCTWSGSASSGTSPYSYSWSALNTSQSGQYLDYTNDAADGSSFTIQLSVTDGSGTQAVRTKTVTARSTARECLH